MEAVMIDGRLPVPEDFKGDTFVFDFNNGCWHPDALPRIEIGLDEAYAGILVLQPEAPGKYEASVCLGVCYLKQMGQEAQRRSVTLEGVVRIANEVAAFYDRVSEDLCQIRKFLHACGSDEATMVAERFVIACNHHLQSLR